MSKKPESKEEIVEPKEPVKPVEPTAAPAAPISIMGEPKAPAAAPQDNSKVFGELKASIEGLEKKIDQFIPKPVTEPPAPPTPEPKKYRIFDELEIF